VGDKKRCEGPGEDRGIVFEERMSHKKKGTRFLTNRTIQKVKKEGFFGHEKHVSTPRDQDPEEVSAPREVLTGRGVKRKEPGKRGWASRE